MAIIRVDPNKLVPKSRLGQQHKYGRNAGMKPKGYIATIKKAPRRKGL